MGLFDRCCGTKRKHKAPVSAQSTPADNVTAAEHPSEAALLARELSRQVKKEFTEDHPRQPSGEEWEVQQEELRRNSGLFEAGETSFRGEGEAGNALSARKQTKGKTTHVRFQEESSAPLLERSETQKRRWLDTFIPGRYSK